ncbi:restriction endonuclease subunit S [Achromobacter aegrifaciens]|uniref:Type I restriction enzyme EcoKI specificity protein n=1 Tax=Achromobacter aegrifaciens TaxID=1287736 RepID=A0AAD2J3C4_ACHAE|nr:restriction endonuclease subunit S [Achromobacter aegrifaciens]CUJ58212.1 Type I restriction enzyme EcoKI specificity protein [Achromobacter aegrifaciens]
MSWELVEAGDLMARRNGSVNPANFSNEKFELHSIPAFDLGRPEVLFGSEIGSVKQVVQPNDVMISKIVPHIRRSSVVGKSSGLRQIASGEWIVFRSERFFPQYLRHLLISNQFNAQFMATVSGVGGSLLRARPAEVAKIKIPLPPVNEQRRIAAILDKADALRGQRRAAIAKLDELLQSVFIEMFGDPVTNPKSWPIRKIADLLDSVKYGSSDKATREGEIPILRMNNLTYSGQIELSDLKYIAAKQADEKYLVEPGDILFNRTNSKELVGKTAVYDGPIPMAYAGYLVRGRVNQSNAPEYISAFLNSIWGKTILRNMCKNIVGMANINAREFGSIELPVPPSELQRKFQHYVRAVRTQNQRMQEGMKKLEELFASLQQLAFSGKL